MGRYFSSFSRLKTCKGKGQYHLEGHNEHAILLLPSQVNLGVMKTCRAVYLVGTYLISSHYWDLWLCSCKHKDTRSQKTFQL